MGPFKKDPEDKKTKTLPISCFLNTSILSRDVVQCLKILGKARRLGKTDAPAMNPKQVPLQGFILVSLEVV